ncbi:unnamed protein product, partial [Trichobilharzia regenti]
CPYLYRFQHLTFTLNSVTLRETSLKCFLPRFRIYLQYYFNIVFRCVVRLCAALLSQFANSLAPSLSIILVCGKQVTVGVAQGSEVVVNKPLNPDELCSLLREEVYSHDPVQFSLQQEIILWVSSLLTSNKELFDGIKFIRLGITSSSISSSISYVRQNVTSQKYAYTYTE